MNELPDIKTRTFQFGVRVLTLVRALPRDLGGQVVGRQLARCGTSVGANVEEAQAAESRRDFAHKIRIARKEARESLYWPRLVRTTGMIAQERLQDIVVEADEIVRVLTAITGTLHEGESPDRGELVTRNL
ncbi:MAG: four helix bundle protein [Planctomycetota bacterium]